MTAGSRAARGCRGAALLTVIGLGVKWRAPEVPAETWGWGDRRGLRLCILAALYAGLLVSKVSLDHVAGTCLKFLTTAK